MRLRNRERSRAPGANLEEASRASSDVIGVESVVVRTVSLGQFLGRVTCSKRRWSSVDGTEKWDRRARGVRVLLAVVRSWLAGETTGAGAVYVHPGAEPFAHAPR